MNNTNLFVITMNVPLFTKTAVSSAGCILYIQIIALSLTLLTPSEVGLELFCPLKWVSFLRLDLPCPMGYPYSLPQRHISPT